MKFSSTKVDNYVLKFTIWFPNSTRCWLLSATVQCRDKRPTHTHTQFLCIRVGTHACDTRECLPLLFIAINFLCVLLFGWTNDYSFLTETNICFSARMYTCLEFRTDQWNSRRMKFTAISTRFLNLGWESPIYAVFELTYFWNKSQQFFTISFR